MGAPDTLDDVEGFLVALFSDPDMIRLPSYLRRWQPRMARMLARRRAPLVRPRYALIGDGSPLRAITMRQAAELERRIGVPVLVAMRYSRPRADEVARRLRDLDAQNVLLLPLFPHYSHSTTGSSLRDMREALGRAGVKARVHAVLRWGLDEAYVDLLARTCLDAASGRASPPASRLILSAHGIPERYARQGDPYPFEVEATAKAVQARVAPGFASVDLVYQSAIGPVRWLSPDARRTIVEHARAGARDIVLSPLGFVSDHIETLYDMDVDFARAAADNGVTRFTRVPSFNDSAPFIRVLEGLAARPAPLLEVSASTTSVS
jgi:ferrochelatase